MVKAVRTSGYVVDADVEMGSSSVTHLDTESAAEDDEDGDDDDGDVVCLDLPPPCVRALESHTFICGGNSRRDTLPPEIQVESPPTLTFTPAAEPGDPIDFIDLT
jgi:hypothetical protein